MHILIQTILTVANIICAVWMYEQKSYKTAIFNGFAAGVSFAILLTLIF